jgi:crossover junction endodeoxyribonuclease RuvC
MGSGRPKPLDFGCIKPPVNSSLPKRYLIILQALQSLLTLHTPIAIAIESQFVYKNVASASKLSMAKAMALVAAEERNIPIFEYCPKKAKLAVTGRGGSSKAEVQRAVQLVLQLSALPEPEDAADALALALCHAHNVKLKYES